MPTITLSSESVLLSKMAINVPSFSCFKPLKVSKFSCISPSNKLLNRNSSRYLRKCCNNMHDGTFGHFLSKVSDNLHTIDSDDTDSSSISATKLIYDINGFSASDDSTLKMNLSRESDPFLDTKLHNFLKTAVLCGIFILQATGQAASASDFDSGLQSNSFFGDLSDITTGFTSAFLLIFFSELGDKTFFIAALLAARNSSFVVFLGTFGALGVMTIISVVLGRTFHYVDEILPFRFGDSDLPLDDIAAVLLLVYFGVSTLLDAASGDGMKADEEQKEAELAVSDFSGDGAGILAAASTIVSTFLLVFVAEWGDKSFFSTIALAAASSPLGVIGGALAGHGSATLLAVLGGSLLGTFLSEKVIAYVGAELNITILKGL
ncbi:GDT1-like protein 1, chloroplastic [Heracleum sosnowskyi]|uniref:GDT1 family protein n=1 Tax=Heracleum sosnowskyi TaxID=360622 RepID=A0AAD8I1X0_9APIA|nr:GDT1-like protein 1, chloroplastic [Heracleum sosnowskyi]